MALLDDLQPYLVLLTAFFALLQLMFMVWIASKVGGALSNPMAQKLMQGKPPTVNQALGWGLAMAMPYLVRFGISKLFGPKPPADVQAGIGEVVDTTATEVK